jgi:hypothetical protein
VLKTILITTLAALFLSLLQAADAGPVAVWLVLLALLVGPLLGLLAAWVARSPRMKEEG